MVIPVSVLMCTDTQISRDLIKQILVDEEGVNSPESGHASPHPVSPPHGYERPGGWGAVESTALVDGLRPYARVREDETESILEALRRHQGNKTRAAISLGMTPRQLRYRIQKLGLEV